MTVTSAIQRAFEAATLEFRADWQWVVRLGTSFDDMRNGTIAAGNFAFISYGAIEGNDEALTDDGRYLHYSRAVDLWIVYDGDPSPIVDAYLNYMNSDPGRNSYIDEYGSTRTIRIDYCSPRTTEHKAFEINHKVF